MAEREEGEAALKRLRRDLEMVTRERDDARVLLRRSKHLTEEVWNEYKDQKDDAGVPFKTCIMSGCVNVDSGVGVYAGSHSAYKKFNKLFDPIIQDYHGHSPSAKHVSEMNTNGL